MHWCLWAVCQPFSSKGTKELTACHNDCLNVKEYLENVHGFREEEMMILMDDGQHQMPTKENIENGMCLLTKYSQPNDVVFVSFSGHGGNTEDLDGDEDDGMDETLIPVDFMENGHIVDDDILKMLVKPMRRGVVSFEEEKVDIGHVDLSRLF